MGDGVLNAQPLRQGRGPAANLHRRVRAVRHQGIICARSLVTAEVLAAPIVQLRANAKIITVLHESVNESSRREIGERAAQIPAGTPQNSRAF